MTVFYALKVANDAYFIPHICIVGGIGIICFMLAFVYLCMVWFKLNSAQTLHAQNKGHEEPTALLCVDKYEPVFYNPPVTFKQDCVLTSEVVKEQTPKILSPGASSI